MQTGAEINGARMLNVDNCSVIQLWICLWKSSQFGLREHFVTFWLTLNIRCGVILDNIVLTVNENETL